MKSPGKITFSNGAVDNATGVAGILEIARAFSKTSPPDRSILFIAVTAEESGLLGSKYFAEHPIIPLKNVVGRNQYRCYASRWPHKRYDCGRLWRFRA